MNEQGFKGRDRAATLRTCWAMCLGLVLVDQLTKMAVEQHPSLSRHPFTVIPGFFDLVLVFNTGAAWGILKGQNWLLFGVSLAVTLALWKFHRAITEGWPERYYAIFLVLSGIVGNSIDRLFRDGVVDFLDFYIGSRHWPAFNIADSAICVGVFIIVLSSLLRPAPQV